MYLAQNLKYLREQKDINQDELAKFLKTARSTIANWEVGNKEPRLRMLVSIAEYFGVTLDDLVLKDLRPALPLYAINLRYLRNKQGLTQENMAQRIGYKQGYSAFENGKVKPNVDALLLLADCFGITLDQLVKQDLSKEGTT